MRRLSSVSIGVCMVPIAGSIGGVFVLAFKFDGRTAAIVARAALVCMAMYNALQAREIAVPAA